MTYQFRRMTPADIGLVNGWIETPHVAEWWLEAGGASTLIGEADFEEPDFRMWLVSLDGRPFAYMQDYNPGLYPDHYFFDRPAPVRGIDQFIGEPGMMGRGHGQAFVRQRVAALFAEGMGCIVTDPHPA
ncbi:MAG: GNAT family N-acetyltransferase, partial [Asticcacaulis sp.]